MNIWIEKVHSEFCLSNFEFLWVKETNKSIPLRSIRDSLPKNYSSAIDLNSKCIKCDENFHQFLLFIEYLSYIHPYHIVYELHFYNTKTILLEILSGASYHENDFIKYEHFVRVYSRKIKKNSLLFMNITLLLWTWILYFEPYLEDQSNVACYLENSMNCYLHCLLWHTLWLWYIVPFGWLYAIRLALKSKSRNFIAVSTLSIIFSN